MGSTSSLFVYDEAGHLLGEYDSSGNRVQQHIWLGDRPVAVLTSAGLDYVQTDQLNTPRVITNSSQAVVWSLNSDPFGNGSPSGSFTYNLRFPGQYYDAETGHNYNYNRDYNPATGRYSESDPIGLAGGINTYVYTLDNPLSNTDPAGTSVPIPAPFILPLPAPVPTLAQSAAAAQALQAAFDKISSTAQSDAQTAADWLLDEFTSPLQMSKGGTQNLENEYSREARQHPDPCGWLREQYDSATSSAERMKIKTAQKVLGCRRNTRCNQ